MWIVLFLLIGVLVLLLLSIVVTFYFYNVGITRKPTGVLAEATNPIGEQVTPTDEEWLLAHPFENLSMQSYDELRLRGYYLAAKEPTGKTALLVHGYTGSAKRDMVGFARMYHELFEFNVLMVDDRGHGESEGTYIGLGWHDRLDVIRWMHFVMQKVEQPVQIVLHGLSMGGATVLMTSGEVLPEQVKCVIEDCGYTSVKDILSYQLHQTYHLPPFPLIPLTSLMCKLRAGYSFGEASALAQVRKTTLPVLFIHGSDDTFVPVAMIHPLYEACPTYKEKLIVQGAGHGEAYAVDQAGYTQRVGDFVHKFVS